MWKVRRVAFRLPSLGSQKKGERVPLFSSGLHLAAAFKSEELALSNPFMLFSVLESKVYS